MSPGPLSDQVQAQTSPAEVLCTPCTSSFLPCFLASWLHASMSSIFKSSLFSAILFFIFYFSFPSIHLLLLRLFNLKCQILKTDTKLHFNNPLTKKDTSLQDQKPFSNHIYKTLSRKSYSETRMFALTNCDWTQFQVQS